MMKSSRGGASYYLCEYQSRDRETFGVEVCFPEKDGLQGLLASLRSMGRWKSSRGSLASLWLTFPETLVLTTWRR